MSNVCLLSNASLLAALGITDDGVNRTLDIRHWTLDFPIGHVLAYRDRASNLSPVETVSTVQVTKLFADARQPADG